MRGNIYLQDHGLVPIVVCSRSKEYKSLSEQRRLKLMRAVEIQPLSEDQITRILVGAGEQLAGLRQTLETDAKLRKLTSLPLMLNLMILAYQDVSSENILQPSPLSDRQQVLAAYVQRRLYSRRAERARFIPERTRRWLIWLAGQMTSRNQTEFYLEQVQPDWLPIPLSRSFYRVLVRQYAGRAGIALDGNHLHRPQESIKQSAQSALMVGGALGLVLGAPFVAIGLVVWLRFGLGESVFLLLPFGLLYCLPGLSMVLSFGGGAVLQHYILRFLLWHAGCIPLRFLRFLDEAAESLLLRKVGNGYVFVHRLVQDYFASLGKLPQAESDAKVSE